MNSKYRYIFDNEAIRKNIIRLINQTWKLIPMRENGEDWETHLKVVIEEIFGLSEIFENDLDFLILLSKLEGLNSEVCKDFMIYRKVVFKCINLLARERDRIE